MPDEFSIQNLRLVPNRKGSIGSDILRRFTVLFNYPEQKIYLRKNAHFRDPFLFNKSGLDIQHDGMTWESDLVKIEPTKRNALRDGVTVFNSAEGFQYNFVLKPKYSVAGCRADSPCAAAGLLKNDKIISINRKKASSFTLERINNLLRGEDGTKITFEVERNSRVMNFQLILADPIPYQDAD